MKIAFVLLFVASGVCSVSAEERTIVDVLHTGWAVADGAPSGVHEFAQTADGYLWLASTTGLFRFDGVRFQRYEPKEGGSLQFRDISALLATPDGGLWIGRAGRAIFLKHDRAVIYGRDEGVSTATVFRFALDRDGTIWAATSRGLMRFEQARWNRVRDDWNFSAASATDAFVDSRGTLWVTVPGALYSLAPHAHAFAVRTTASPWLMREGPDRTLWMSEGEVGIRAVTGALAQIHDTSKPTLAFSGDPRQMLVDRNGKVWFTDDGIARLDPATGLVERFTQKNGLTADTAVTVLEDREGNIWVATTAGVDRFRRRNIVPGPFPFDHETLALVTDAHGLVLAASGRALMQVADGVVSTRAVLHMPASYHFTRGGIRCAFRDQDGVFWLGGHGVLIRVTGATAESVDLPSEALANGPLDVQAITRDQAGDLWISIQQRGVFRRHGRAWTQFGRDEGLQSGRSPVTLWTDARGRIWFGYVGTRISVLDGQKSERYSSEDLHIGTVTFIGGQADRVWVVGQYGFALFDGHAFHTIAGDADAGFRGISGVVQTSNGDFWLNQGTGLAHIPAATVAKRFQDPRQPLDAELFDFRDGVPSSATTIEPIPSAVLAADGRIWLSGSNGTYWIDPAHIYKNPVPPTVRIEAIYAGDRRYDPADPSRLPASPSTVQIDYTALSLSIPDRVRFRYQLEGVDRDWQDAGTRRAAYYTRLPPGQFRFHVIASNNDGVWNETGATATVIVPPAFFQTSWFLVLCGSAMCGLLWLAYVLRTRQLAARMHSRFEERVAERSRIARDLHDTLLQSFQGLMLRLQVVDDLLPEGSAKHQLDAALERADQAIAEGRNAVYDLRRAGGIPNDFPQAIKAVGEELAVQGAAAFHLVVEGTTRDLQPILRDEVYRITREAIRNAYSHARAQHIETEIAYGSRTFRVRIRDDGDGIQSQTLADGRPGHYGLQGMRERARQIAGTLDIWSRPGAGTEIDLTISGAIAYGPPAHRHVRRSLRRSEGDA